jgi:AcrR family transcriptional regulator
MTTKRSDILQATLELISEHGFHGTAMSEVASRAGVGAGTIYRYFQSKEDLITRLYLEVKGEMLEAFLAGYAENLPLRDRFRTLWFNMLAYFCDHPQKLAFLEQFTNSPFMTAAVKKAHAEGYAPIVRFFEYGFREGVLKEMPLEMLGVFTINVASALAKLRVSGELDLDEQTKELAVSACWDALKR